MPVDQARIKQIIPHRGDMLLIDEVRELSDSRGVGIKHITDKEFWCAGHFPGDPIMPGVLQVEALAQVACFIAFKSLGTTGDKNKGYFTTMEKIKFFSMVKPGDTLELHVEVLMKKMRLYKFHGIATVGGRKVSEATFTAIMDISTSGQAKGS